MTNGMIFDLQLFADVTLTATSANDQVHIKKNDTTVTAVYTNNETTSIPGAGNDPDWVVKAVNAGSGADTISVDSDVTAIKIIGGKGNDSINIATGATGGNTYLYNSGDGKDTITGAWNATYDILEIAGSTYTTAMAMNGYDFIVKVGSGTITFKDALDSDTGNQKITSIKINGTYTGDDDRSTKEFDPQKIMQGTSSAETIDNSSYAGHAAKDGYTLDGGAGNDKILNSGNNVYILGGAGNDHISLTADHNVQTSDVSIIGGLGNDYIWLGDDKATAEGGSETLASHVYIYNVGDGKDVINGFNDGDTIKIYGVNAANQPTVVQSINESDVDEAGNLVIKVGSGSITLNDVIKKYAG